MVPPATLAPQEARRIVDEVDIPPCPAVLTAVLKEMRREEPDFPAMGTRIASDLGLSAALLKTVNSPFYGLGRKVTSVQQAIAYLGVNAAVRLVTGLLLQQVFPVYRNPVITRLWTESSRFAAGMARLAREFDAVDVDEAYTFGLFRDCGMLLMARRHPGYEKLLGPESVSHDASLLGAEISHYVVDHATVGYYMAESWYLPASLAMAVQNHHDIAFVLNRKDEIQREARVLVALGTLVERAAPGTEPPADGHLRDPLLVVALACLGAQARQLPELLASVREARDAQDEE